MLISYPDLPSQGKGDLTFQSILRNDETYDRTSLGLHMAPVATPVVLPSPQALKSPSLMESREQARSARETNEKHMTGMIPGTSEKRAGIFN